MCSGVSSQNFSTKLSLDRDFQILCKSWPMASCCNAHCHLSYRQGNFYVFFPPGKVAEIFYGVELKVSAYAREVSRLCSIESYSYFTSEQFSIWHFRWNPVLEATSIRYSHRHSENFPIYSISFIPHHLQPFFDFFFTGVVLQFYIVNASVWWLFHVLSIFYAVMFPFKARRWKKKEKYIHLVLLIVGKKHVCLSLSPRML